MKLAKTNLRALLYTENPLLLNSFYSKQAGMVGIPRNGYEISACMVGHMPRMSDERPKETLCELKVGKR